MAKTERRVESDTLDPTREPLSAHSSRLNYAVSSAPFAGRIGGNQEFVVTPQDDDASEVLKKLPDAAPLVSLRDSLNLQGFLVRDNWQMAIIEGWGTCLLVALLGGMASGLTTFDVSPMVSTLYAALATSFGITLFILAGAPVSGGHFNPIVTMATFFAGLSTLPRSLLYIVAQCIGALIAGYWLRLGLGDAFFPVDIIPGCTVDSTKASSYREKAVCFPGSQLRKALQRPLAAWTCCFIRLRYSWSSPRNHALLPSSARPNTLQVSAGQLFALEFVFAQALLFTAFGVGLDPRQAKVFGPALAPILVGLILGLSTLASGISKPGHTGISANPARCLGLMVAKNNMQYHYVHWLADLAACMTNGAFYYFIPPYVPRRGR